MHNVYKTDYGSITFPRHLSQSMYPVIPPANPAQRKVNRCFAGINLKTTIVRMSKPMRAVTTKTCLLYTSDAADERSSVDLGGRRIIQKKKYKKKKKRKQNTTRTKYSTKPI